MKLGSLFDGIGGFPLVATWHGITPVWASEIEPACVSITKRHFPDMKHLGDITKINGAEIEPVDIITFGSPCQDLSVAGKRAGLVGERSGLFGEAIRIIEEMRSNTNGEFPTWAIWENVPGALSSNDGLDFRAVLQSFADCEIPVPTSGRWATAGMVRGGRCDVAWRILDAQYWGVPQRRRRIFLVADFGGQRAAEVLFKPEGLRGNFKARGAAGEEVAGGVGDSVEESNCDFVYPKIARTLAARYDSSPCVDRGQNIVCIAGELYENHAQDSRVTGPLDVSPTVSQKWGTGGGNTPIICAGFNGWRSVSGDVEYADDKAPCVQATIPPNVICAGGVHSKAAVDVNLSPTLTRSSDLPYIVAGFCHKAAAAAGSIGYQEEVSPTLKAGQTQAVFVCRTDQTGSNGLGVSEDVSYTLDGSNGQAVCLGGTQPHAAIELDLSPTLTEAMGAGGGHIPIVSLDCRNLAENEELSGTLQAKNNGGYSLNYINPVLQKQIIRRITPTECERLMGFPDGWTLFGLDPSQYAKSLRKGMARTGLPEEVLLKKISDAARYRALGNSVALPCVVYVLGGIAEVLS